MIMRNLPYEELKHFCEGAFQRFGFPQEDSAFITDTLLKSDLFGITSHGTNRIGMYHGQIRQGLIDCEAVPQVVFETPVSAVVDGNRGMGQLVSRFAMEKAMALAKKSGIGLVSVRNSNHFGIAGYYSLMASERGYLGMAMTNSLAAVVPTFGRIPMLGTNPLAFTFPASPAPFHFDASTSVVTVGKIEVAEKMGKTLPLGWGIGAEGKEEQNPSALLQSIYAGTSGLHPLGGGTEEFGGHKGYGISMMVEILTSILSLGTPSHLVEKEEGQAGVCHFFAAIDPKIFGDPQAIQQHLSGYLEALRQSPKTFGQERIYIHGEKEREAYAVRILEGVPVTEGSWNEMRILAEDLGLKMEEYFQES